MAVPSVRRQALPVYVPLNLPTTGSSLCRHAADLSPTEPGSSTAGVRPATTSRSTATTSIVARSESERNRSPMAFPRRLIARRLQAMHCWSSDVASPVPTAFSRPTLIPMLHLPRTLLVTGTTRARVTADPSVVAPAMQKRLGKFAHCLPSSLSRIRSCREEKQCCERDRRLSACRPAPRSSYPRNVWSCRRCR